METLNINGWPQIHSRSKTLIDKKTNTLPEGVRFEDF